MEYTEDFIGFYTHTGFWLDHDLDLTTYRDARRLAGIVGEVALSYSGERFKAAITVEGMILLHLPELARKLPPPGDPEHFDEWTAWWEEFLDHAYALQVFLESESIHREHPLQIEIGEVVPGSTTKVTMFDFAPLSAVPAGGRIIHQDIRDLNSYIDFVRLHGRVPQQFAFSTVWWPKLSKETVRAAFEKFELTLANPERTKWLALIARSKVAHSKNDFAISFLLSWFVIEASCKRLYAHATDTRGDTEKREIKTGMDTLLKILLESESITADAYRAICAIKKIRNALMHQHDRTVISSSDCVTAGGLALNLSMREQPANIVLKWSCELSY